MNWFTRNNPWSFRGTLGRFDYLFWGIVLCSLKAGIDWFVTTLFFDKTWSVTSYWFPFDGMSLSSVEAIDSVYVLLVLAIPFAWAGLALTIRRLRSASISLWISILYFVPGMNMLLFLTGVFAPGREENEGISIEKNNKSGISWIIPQHELGSAIVAIFAGLFVAATITVIGIYFYEQYGWGLFVAGPASIGFVTTLLYGWNEPRSLLRSQIVTTFSVFLIGIGILYWGIEGLICLGMALPIVLFFAIPGTILAHLILEARWNRLGKVLVTCLVIAFAPIVMGAVSLQGLKAPVFKTTTSIEIDAPPHVVWKHVVSFSELPPPTDWVFKTGLAYPIRANIEGSGVGAMRTCLFSTGAFYEPITVWDEPYHLKFSVLETPHPMKEMSIYSDINPPHLEGFFISRAGEFRLIPLGGGRTRIEGTTWYEHNMWPATYWKWWMDFVIHRIHLRVLKHIKRRSE